MPYVWYTDDLKGNFVIKFLGKSDESNPVL